MKRFVCLLALSIFLVSAGSVLAKKGFCPKVYHKGVMELDINPAFLSVDQYNTPSGEKADGLTISSFFNFDFLQVGPDAVEPIVPPFAMDQVGIVRNIGDVDPESFEHQTDFEKITDLSWTVPKTVWPNEATRVPDGVLDFEAVIAPQGFHVPLEPGRLSIINLDDPQKREYIVHQSTLNGNMGPHEPGNAPRFYHETVFHDMDDDGLKDIVTVRSGFRIVGDYPPFSELVYFRNPGTDIDPDEAWDEVILYGGPLVYFMGPDIHLTMHDFEGDGVPEIVATHFFTGDPDTIPPSQPTKGQIVIYGAPVGETWSQVDMTYGMLPRAKMISDDQGFPFAVEVADLNGDGEMEILATNHQPNCAEFPTIPGRVYALEQPASGDIFADEWPVHVLLDNIRPQPSVFGACRLAPGHAMTFYPKEKDRKHHKRPWILVSGDEAGKIWIMKPKGRDFDYKTAVVFDINDYYGPGTTQTLMSNCVTISTIGKVAFRYDNDDNGHGHCHGKHHKHHAAGCECKHKHKKRGVTEIYIPVFEAQDIHIISFKKERGLKKIKCPADTTLQCPTP